jgi:hypothetical protein
LSYNRFSGELSSSFTSSFEDIPAASLKQSINRLSGEIPQSLEHATKLTILDGNVFSCDVSGSSLPEHDCERSDYSCGSNAFNVPYYTWMTAAGVLAFVCCGFALSHIHWYYGCRGEGTEEGWARVTISLRGDWLAATETDDSANPSSSAATAQPAPVMRNVHSVGNLLGGMRKLTGRCAAYGLVILGPIYIICGVYYGTYTYQYAWTVSASFLSGGTVTRLLFAACALKSAAPVHPYCTAIQTTRHVLFAKRI